jgi:hypothetical protein
MNADLMENWKLRVQSSKRGLSSLKYVLLMQKDR